jgi:cytoskeletal protein CcmA (bactofilin family)
MFRKPDPSATQPVTPAERVTSVLGSGIIWKGALRGSGGIRIEGTFEGDIAIHGLVVVGESGRVSCKDLRANTVIIAGSVNGNITAEKLEIRSTGRVWGDVVIGAFASEEGAFLRGQVRMEDKIDLHFEDKPAESPVPVKPETGPIEIPEKKKPRKVAG